MAIQIEIQNKAEVEQIRQRQETYLLRKKQDEFQKEILEKYEKLKAKIKDMEGK
jgi:thymidylate kinase